MCFSCKDRIPNNTNNVKVCHRWIIKQLSQYESYTFLKSQRGKPILVLNGYKYRRERSYRASCEYWRCLRSGCHGRIVMRNGVIGKSHNHSHDPDEVKITYC